MKATPGSRISSLAQYSCIKSSHCDQSLPLINHLEFHLDVDAETDYENWETDSDGEVLPLEPKQSFNFINLGYQRASEVFLDNDLLAPLQNLSNDKSCAFTFSENLDHGDSPYQPLPKHVRMIRQLKQTIERNSSAY